MIEAYTGTPGSGKSYHAALVMWERIKYGHPVVTNIPLTFHVKHFPKIQAKREHAYNFMELQDITPKKLIEFSEKVRQEKGVSRLPEDYIYLVIDEAQLVFNCRDWQAKNRMEWISFFQLHRKLGYHVILVTQVSKMLDNQMRGLLEYEVIHRKASNFGFKGIFVSALLLSPTVFICVRVWAALREKVGSELFRYSKRIARLYDTNKMY